MHYTELHEKLKHEGFNCNIFDEVVDKPRIYLNGYFEGDGYTPYPNDAIIYLFSEPVRKQNDYSNPISGYGLSVVLKSTDGMRPLEINRRRCHIKQMVMTDLWKAGFGLKPVQQVLAIGL